MEKLTLKKAKAYSKIVALVVYQVCGVTRYPADKWVAISENYDLNLWKDWETNRLVCYATLYPVKNNKTDYSKFYRVFTSE